jgi:FKBP-type peptidyl-prolyl cis-trans isomerase
MKRFFLRSAFGLLAWLAAASPLCAQRERFPMEDLEIIEKRWPDAKRTATSLRYVVLKEGDRKGALPQPGMTVSVLYKGTLLDGKVFDQALDPAQPFRTRVAREEVIPAWDEVLQKMHRGDKWLVIVPYELGYGTRGRPPIIPKRATLVFEMELVDFGAK